MFTMTNNGHETMKDANWRRSPVFSVDFQRIQCISPLYITGPFLDQ